MCFGGAKPFFACPAVIGYWGRRMSQKRRLMPQNRVVFVLETVSHDQKSPFPWLFQRGFTYFSLRFAAGARKETALSLRFSAFRLIPTELLATMVLISDGT